MDSYGTVHTGFFQNTWPTEADPHCTLKVAMARSVDTLADDTRAKWTPTVTLVDMISRHLKAAAPSLPGISTLTPSRYCSTHRVNLLSGTNCLCLSSRHVPLLRCCTLLIQHRPRPKSHSGAYQLLHHDQVASLCFDACLSAIESRGIPAEFVEQLAEDESVTQVSGSRIFAHKGGRARRQEIIAFPHDQKIHDRSELPTVDEIVDFVPPVALRLCNACAHEADRSLQLGDLVR